MAWTTWKSIGGVRPGFALNLVTPIAHSKRPKCLKNDVRRSVQEKESQVVQKVFLLFVLFLLQIHHI